MSDPIDERILQTVEAAVRGISTSNGYYTTMKRVTDDREGPYNAPEKPAAAVIAFDDRQVQQRNNFVQDRALVVGVEVWFDVKEPKQSRLIRSRTRADVYRAVMADRFRGTLAAETTFLSSLPMVAQETALVEGVLLTFEVLYRTSPEDLSIHLG